MDFRVRHERTPLCASICPQSGAGATRPRHRRGPPRAHPARLPDKIIPPRARPRRGARTASSLPTWSQQRLQSTRLAGILRQDGRDIGHGMAGVGPTEPARSRVRRRRPPLPGRRRIRLPPQGLPPASIASSNGANSSPTASTARPAQRNRRASSSSVATAKSASGTVLRPLRRQRCPIADVVAQIGKHRQGQILPMRWTEERIDNAREIGEGRFGAGFFQRTVAQIRVVGKQTLDTRARVECGRDPPPRSRCLPSRAPAAGPGCRRNGSGPRVVGPRWADPLGLVTKCQEHAHGPA